MTRALPLKLALLCWLAAALAAPARALTVQQEAGGLRVRTASYSALVDPANGARITSLQVDGAEMTHLCPDGHGGLIEETHTADLPFQILRQDSDGRRLVLALSGRAGTLRITKEFTFYEDAPAFSVRLTFENASPFDLAGADAPALRNLVLPAGGRATGRELYCMARGRGAEILSADFLLARAYGDGPAGVLRWAAIAEPAGRRALGFALAEGASRPLPPLRAQGGGLLTGWAVPTVPAGSSLTVNVLVVPLSGFTAVAELNGRFAADALVDISGPTPVIHLNLMPLEALPDLSIITRTYDAQGHEMGPCDPLLIDRLQAFKVRQGDVACPANAAPPAWFVHEVYSAGRRLAAFAVPVGAQAAPLPPTANGSGAAPPVPTALTGAGQPGAHIPVTAERSARGFVLWRFDGPPAADEVKDLRLFLSPDDRQTVFFGLRALHSVDGLRVTVAPADASRGGAPLPPSALYLWRVIEGVAGPARLQPFSGTSLRKGETTYLALTADASRLDPGRYSARLVVSVGPAALEVPLSLQVLPTPPAGRDAFGLWYLGADGATPLDAPALQKLSDYGVRAVTLPVDESTAAAVRTGLPDTQLSRMTMLAFANAGGVLPPSAPAPGALPLARPDPLWLVRAEASTAAAVQAAVQAAYSPALLCERLPAVPQEFFQAAGKDARPVYLVRGGPEPGAVARLVASGAMDSSAPVFLYLDLRGVDWRRAALQVHSAAWTAAYQGLAGLAVTCDAPARKVDRQLVIWHILHDAGSEAALWRRASRAAADATAGASPPRDAILAQQGLEGVIGLSDSSTLPVRAVRVPFRQVYRVAPAADKVADLSRFADARQSTLELAAGLAPLFSTPAARNAYWRGIPFAESGEVRWTVFAAPGQADAVRAAQDFESGVEQLTGKPLPIVSTWPDPAPALVWAFVDGASWSALPLPVRAALDKRAGAAFLAADLPDGTAVAVVSPSLDTKKLLDALLPAPGPYPAAGGVR